jgi:ubiquinone/menaquinone biosynthesis C-methylase UbiE
MKNNYDNIARYYDFLSSIVFGSSQRNAQIALLPYIAADSHVLIAGGGTGWILEEIAEKCLPGLHIYYIEISAKMITEAKKKRYQPNDVTFINMAIEDFDLTDAGLPGFDVIITPFLFDNFKEERIPGIFLHLHKMLLTGGSWLFTDFHYQKKAPFWQRILLNSMYVFFSVLCAVEASALANMAPLFQSQGYHCLYETYYFNRFIRSAVYRKDMGI